MSDVLTVTDLETAKKHDTFHSEVITGKAGGLSSGSDIDYATNQVTGQVQKTLPRVLRDLGMMVQTWTATTGGTLTDASQVFLNDITASAWKGNYYAWTGVFPKVVAPGTDPAAVAGFVMRSDAGLRSELIDSVLRTRNGELALRDFVSVLDGFGVAGDGVTYDDAAISAAISSQQSLLFPARTYRLNAAIQAIVGSGKKLAFMPGSKFISDNLSDGIMFFSGTADGLSIVGSPELGYSSAPSVRLAHAIYIRGETITNLLIDGPRVLNGANMAVAVFCGNNNTTASGSKNITIRNIRSSNTLGDTVHVEGADSDVSIYNIDADNSGDDVVAVVNYTGTGSAPKHPTQTKCVQIRNINTRDAVTSSISLGGVSDFVVDGVTEKAKAGSLCITVKMVHDADYAVGNSDGIINNIVTDGASKIIAVDTPASGTAYNRRIHFGVVKGKNISNTAVFASNSGSASDGRISDVTIDSLSVNLAASARPWYISNTKNVRLGVVNFSGGSVEALTANSIGFSWDSITAAGLSASSAPAMAVVTSSVDKAGDLNISAASRPTGLLYQSNTKTVHNGIWSVKDAATNNYVLGSNSNVSGFFGEASRSVYVGDSVSAGTTSTITISNPPAVASDGAATCHIVSATSNEGLAWGYKNATASEFTMVWSSSLSYVFVNYVVSYKVA